MNPVELCEPSPSERRPRIRTSRPPTSLSLSSSECTFNAKEPLVRGRRPVPLALNVEQAPNEKRGRSRMSCSQLGCINSNPGAQHADFHSIQTPPEKSRSSTSASIREFLLEGRPRTPPAATAGVRRLRRPTLLSASQSMPDLPSEVEKRESRKTRVLRILRCRKAIRDWIERQWMQRHGKEVERRVGEQELMQYKQMFAMLDADGSGSLDVEELRSAMRFIGMKVPIRELRERIAVVDVSRDGLIDMQEFVHLMTKGSFEGFDVSSQREQQRQKAAAAAAEDDSIVTGAPRRFVERDQQRRRRRGRDEEVGVAKKSGEPKAKEPLMGDLPFFLWIPAYHRRRTMALLMQGKVVPDLENLSRDSYAPYEHLDGHRAEKVVKEREGALKNLTFVQRHRPPLPMPLVARKPRGGSPFKYEPPVGLPEPYSKAKPTALVRAETRLHLGMGFSPKKKSKQRPRITDVDVRVYRTGKLLCET